MTERRIAITGLGLVTPLGLGRQTFWDGILERRTAVRPTEGFEHEYPTTHYAQIPPLNFDDHLDARQTAMWSRASKLAVLTGNEAVADAGASDLAGPRTGVILGTGYGCALEFEDLYDTYFHKGWKRIKPITVPRLMSNAPASHLGIRFGARGVNFTVATACSSGAIAAGLAAQQIRAGTLDACITGGVDLVINASTGAAWNNLRVLSRRNDATASRPFSGDRDGLVFGEGCAIVILEEWSRAEARGARIYAELAGVGATNDATNIVGPDTEGEVMAVREALADAGLTPDDVDYVSAHGTSTEANDKNETAVIKQVFGARAATLPVSSIKGHIGHTMGAAGAIELASTALAIHHQTLPPTLHYTPGDDGCDLDYVADGPRDAHIGTAITNSFGFGGQNSVLVLRRCSK